jgi:hypothetical protein
MDKYIESKLDKKKEEAEQTGDIPPTAAPTMAIKPTDL